MNFPNDLFGLVLLVFAALVIIGAWIDRAYMGRKEDAEDQLKLEVKAWVEALGFEFVAINRGSDWHWIVDPWNPPWAGTKWEAFYDEVFFTKRSGER